MRNEVLETEPVLKRNFGFFTILGLIENGGPSSIIYRFILVWGGTLSLFLTLSELVSMALTSGGQYHWVSMLAPPSGRNFLGYLTGWLTLTGWQAFVASGAYLTGIMIQGLIILTPGTLLFWAVIFLSYCINSSTGSNLAEFEGIVLFIYILGGFAVIPPLIIAGQPSSADAVQSTWLNVGNWPTQGLSFSIGIKGNSFLFPGADLGADRPIHMSEEIWNASTVIPRFLLTGLIINGSLGDNSIALHENPIFPFIRIFRNVLHSTAATAILSSIPVILGFSATTGVFASASREYLKRANPRTSVPSYAVFTTAIVAILLSLVNIGGSTAFNGAISISIAGLLDLASFVSTPTTGSANLTWGPWRLYRSSESINNALTCAFLVYALFFSFWPAFIEVTPQNMNYVLYYLVWARKSYTGPVIEIAPMHADGGRESI
ncbi:choline transport protein [Xylaria sp. FL0043]|nr:choline transport protein [Xylaria sp. FL0043]